MTMIEPTRDMEDELEKEIGEETKAGEGSNDSFNSFLQDKHAQNYNGIDDDMPDEFARWIQELSSEDWNDYAEEWCASMIKKYN